MFAADDAHQLNGVQSVMSPKPRRANTAAGAPPAARAGRISPALQGLLAFGIYLAVWLLTAARAQVGQAGAALLEQRHSPDPNFYVWSLRWWPYALGRGLNPVYSGQIFAPAGHSLAWATTAPPLSLLAAPLTLTAGPVASFNLIAAVALPVSAWAAFVLCRRLTGKFWAALAGGAVFGFSAYEQSHNVFGQINLTYSLLLPVLAYLVLLWWDEAISSRTLVLLAGLTMTVQFYLFAETFADLTAILALSLAVGFAIAGRSGRADIARLAKVTALAFAAAAVLCAPAIAYQLSNKAPRPARITAMDLASLVLPQPGRTLGIAWLARAAAEPDRISAACYVGIPLLALALLLAVTGWQNRLVRFLSCMLAVVMVASLGPAVYLLGRPVTGLPWAALFRLPVVRNAWPSRLMLFAYLVLAVATALWLARPTGQPGSGRWAPGSGRWAPGSARWALALLGIAGIALNSAPITYARHSTVPAFVSAGQYRRQLSPGEIVVVVSEVRNAGMLWQAESGFYMRIAGGFINAGFTRGTDLPTQVQKLANPTPYAVVQFERYVRVKHIGAILVDAGNEPPWSGIFSRAGLVGHTSGGVTVYPTRGCRACRALDWAELTRTGPQPRSTSG
jgi:hypothetical protein